MRISSVDSVRLIAILFVIAIHTKPFSFAAINNDSFYYYLGLTITQLGRFAVPFFFVISGYFYGVKVNKGACPLLIAKKMLWKLFILYSGWCLVYLMPYNLSTIYEYGFLGPLKFAYWNLAKSVTPPSNLIFQAGKEHLWFLSSLMFCLAIAAIFIKCGAIRALFIISCALYVFGVFAKSYANTELGIAINFDTKNGPFFGTALFATGFWLASHTPTKAWLYTGLHIFVIGSVMHLSEIYFLMRMYNTSIWQDYVFGTYFMGLGAAIISLSSHKALSNKTLAKLGGMSLGVYASHFMFIELLYPLNKKLNHPVWEIFFVIFIFALSLAFSRLLSKSRYTKKLVE